MIDAFSDESATHRFLKTARAGFLRALLDTGLAALVELETQSVAYAAGPENAGQNFAQAFGLGPDGPQDAILDGSRPAVVRTGTLVRVAQMGTASVLVTTAQRRFLDSFLAGILNQAESGLTFDTKFVVAVELYAAYNRESSANASLLTLVMALEALATSAERSPAALAMLDKWRSDIDERLLSPSIDSHDYKSLEGLRQELLFKRHDSIRQQVRRLAMNSLRDKLDEERAEAGKAFAPRA